MVLRRPRCPMIVERWPFVHNDLCASPTLNDGASSTALMIVNVGLVHNDLCASPTLNDGASSTAIVNDRSLTLAFFTTTCAPAQL